ncbi:MAG: rhomboid family intramembrane serine protease [Paludibacteraceae bacterium]|nr:rhomboid family intramembrane serine protease [Paludibacteraceae bacterium]
MSANTSYWGRMPAVTKNLIVINFICWLADYVLTRNLHLPVVQWLGLHYWGSPDFHLWQPLTYMFMHAGFDHIFFNMFAVLMFAPPLEERWGSKRFLIYYLISGIGAAVVQELVWWGMYGPAAAPAVTIGASGAVFGILFAFGWLFPDVKMFLMFIPIPIPARIFVGLYAVVELFLGVAGFSGDNVAHFAHLGGMLFGWLLLLWWRHKDKDTFSQQPYESKLKQWIQRKAASRKDKAADRRRQGTYHYQDPVKETPKGTEKSPEEQEMDRILDKVRREGYDSLTDEEKGRLFRR